MFKINKASIEKYKGYDGLKQHMLQENIQKCQVKLEDLDFFENAGNVCKYISVSYTNGCYVIDGCLYNTTRCTTQDVARILNAMLWIERLAVNNIYEYEGDHSHVYARSGLKEIIYKEWRTPISFNRYILEQQRSTLLKFTGYCIGPLAYTFSKLKVLNVNVLDKNNYPRVFPSILRIYIGGFSLKPHSFNVKTKTVHKSDHPMLYNRCHANRARNKAITTLICCLHRLKFSKDVKYLIACQAVQITRASWSLDENKVYTKDNIQYGITWTPIWEERYKKYCDVKTIEKTLKLKDKERQDIEKEIRVKHKRLKDLDEEEETLRVDLQLKRQKL